MPEQGSSRRSQRWRLSVAVGGASVLCLTLLPGATADDDSYPSREDVRKARERVATVADGVDAIEARLAAADRRLERLSVEAGKAVEAYNGARYQLREARIATRRAERRVDAANARVDRWSERLADHVVSNFENGGPLTNLSILMEEPDPNALLERFDAYETVTGAVQTDLAGYESAVVVADRAQDRAEAALTKQDEATEAAEQAREAAEAAVTEAEDAVSTIAAEKRVLVRRLARAEDISVKLARERKRELAEQAAEEAAEEAAEQAEEQEQEEQQDPPENDSDPAPEEGDPAPEDSDPAPSGDVETAIAFAKEQLGEPYVWGAAGPDSWDCSGLTMEAWEAAGESLSHWSVAQYHETTPIAFSDIRRGDLLFWSDGGDPDTIYHVSMYLGHNRMIQAPQPGENVEIVSLYYWILPDLYTRV